MTMPRLVAGVVVGVLTMTAVLIGPLGGPAAAAVCGPSDGVSVVVDARGLGGALSSACATEGGGKVGSEIVSGVGHPIDYVQRDPGFVCRVSGAPASDPCVKTPPVNAYWGLFWSDGKSGTWSYASVGIVGLRIPAGGSIALAWQSGGERDIPGIAPPVVGASASATPNAGKTQADEAEPGAVEESAAAPTASEGGGLPLAVPLVLLGLLAALAIGAAVRRRRGTGTA
ncbi:MAG: hypothetical protein Q8Q02_15390 [Nocardioides sp.]|nr:hypothetical protein [Nocardioides sp.]